MLHLLCQVSGTGLEMVNILLNCIGTPLLNYFTSTSPVCIVKKKSLTAFIIPAPRQIPSTVKILKSVFSARFYRKYVSASETVVDYL